MASLFYGELFHGKPILWLDILWRAIQTGSCYSQSCYLWLKMTNKSGQQSQNFIADKEQLKEFYFKRLMTRTLGLKASIESELD